MSGTLVVAQPGPTVDPAPRRRRLAYLIGVVAAVAAAVAVAVFLGGRATADATMPDNPAMEQALGIKVVKVAVVGDEGLVQVDYVALDEEKATRFQSDTAHPPVLSSEARDSSTQRVSLMKKGHQMRPGQTYYFIYLNAGTVHSGELATLSYGGFSLEHIPVR